MHRLAASKRLALIAVTSLLACEGPGEAATGSTASQPPAGTPRANQGSVTPDSGVDAPSSSATSPPPLSPPSSGTIGFHLLLGVAGADQPGDALKLDGDGYTELAMSNFVAGAMLGHLLESYTPGMRLDRDYLYGSVFAQLLQENLATEEYVAGSRLIDSAADQQAVMGVGQGGPYQINEYAADMVYGTYVPQGYALVDYVALQKSIGFSFGDAAAQYTKATPAPFNDVDYGPMLVAYFHFNDYVALQRIGPVGGYTPPWEPAYDQAIARFEALPDNFLDVLLNVAYNQGYYGGLVGQYSQLGATATAETLASVDDYASIWGVADTYRQYPYQVRYYLDQLYDRPVPTTSPAVTTTPQNHLRFGMAALADTFARVFAKLAYVDATAGYVLIPQSRANAAFASALSAANLGASAALDLSDAADRARIFDLLDAAITGLEKGLGTDFTARTDGAL